MRRESLKTWNAGIRLPDHDLAATWETYRRAADPAAYNLLVEHYLPLVKYYCQWFHNRLPTEVELDDIMSGGVDGLCRAIRGYDPGRGVKFETYCTACIRGAVLDALRRTDHVSVLMRRRASHLRRSQEELTAELGRPPDDAELADYMGLTDLAFSRVAGDAKSTHLTRLDRQYADQDGDPSACAADNLADTRSERPGSHLQRETLKAMMSRGLSAQERTVLILYYYEALTMKEVGAAIGVSESRVCQMHAAILERLRNSLRDHKDELVSSTA
jgi:RNA polymerase sigma factor for flagellar operon FliA